MEAGKSKEQETELKAVSSDDVNKREATIRYIDRADIGHFTGSM